MSGAKCSTALKILEDGCESFDGLPGSPVPALIDGAAGNGPATAARVDKPARCFSAEPALDPLANKVLPRDRWSRVFFVDSDDDRFECRYTETRSSHLLAGDRPVMDGIRPERQMLPALRDRADLLNDTSLPTATAASRPFAVGLAVADGRLRVFVTSFACLRASGTRPTPFGSGSSRKHGPSRSVARVGRYRSRSLRELRKGPRSCAVF
jgi:RNase adaptor protein for sRNA GlmZ degradation